MPDYGPIVLGCSLLAALCVALQACVKRALAPDRYGYFRDILLAAAWLLVAIWVAPSPARVVTGAAFVSGALGLAERLWPSGRWRMAYAALAMLCALFGPGVSFIRFADGQYVYLSPLLSFVATSLWFFAFPLLFHHLDDIPGLLGHVLAVAFALMLMVGLLMEGAIGSGAFLMSFTGLALLVAFWSRFGNAYRQAGRAMASMWSVLVAGTSILGNSKGIVFSSMLFLALGLFAVPAVELVLHWASGMIADEPKGTDLLYRRMISCGLEHPEAVRCVAALCALFGVVVALLRSPPLHAVWAWWLAAAACAIAAFVPLLRRRTRSIPHDGSTLWGVRFNAFSMNYAVSRARGLISDPGDGSARLVATVNALGMNEASADAGYRAALGRAAMVLADGTGLLWGMRFLGLSVQERVTGIDFAEQLCRTASVSGWPVYFLGAKGDTARACADAMRARYPELIVAGARDGYFDVQDPRVPDAVAASGARILLVAMGLPRQEKWIDAHRRRLGPVLAVGVGGAFDVLAGRLSRAPQWMQRAGLEWLYRLVQEPFRWKKDLGLALFVLRVLATKIGLRPTSEAPQ